MAMPALEAELADMTTESIRATLRGIEANGKPDIIEATIKMYALRELKKREKEAPDVRVPQTSPR